MPSIRAQASGEAKTHRQRPMIQSNTWIGASTIPRLYEVERKSDERGRASSERDSTERRQYV